MTGNERIMYKSSYEIVIITAQCYASMVYDVIVCLSVHLSVTSRSSTKMAKPRITQTTPYNSPGPNTKDLHEIPMGSHLTGVPNRSGVGYNRQFSTDISNRDIVTIKH